MAEQASEPWRVTERVFPTSGSAEEQLRFLLGYAILAPSSHNTQPWHFRIGESRVDLIADRSRGLSVVDPDDRELIISCGAALYNLRLALRCFGFQDTVEPFPDHNEPDLLARVRIAPGGVASAEEQALLAAIPRRRTNRAAFAERPVPPILLDALADAAAAERAWFHVVTGQRERAAVAALIAEGDRLQWADPAFRRELASWMRADWTTRGDGMPGTGFGIGEIESLVAPVLIRTFDMGRGRAAKDQELALGSPVLAVLGTDADTPEAHLEAGQAIARVLLRAAVDDVSASFLNQPNEIPALRTRLRETLGHPGWPQMLVRLGYESPGPHTPRRPVADVVLQ
ncbi:MAG: nitroreductase family protein [Chloroflexi bacterium]|nr:nitroreductase family protein [Chloroflexota bacterium]